MGLINIGDIVAWKWIRGVAEGRVVEIANERIEIISKGKCIARNGDKDNPAIIISHKNGNKVIKLQSELLDSNL